MVTKIQSPTFYCKDFIVIVIIKIIIETIFKSLDPTLGVD